MGSYCMCDTLIIIVWLLQEGKQVLHWAAQYGEMDLLHKLLNERQNLQAMDGKGNTALHLAAAAGQM